MDNDGMPSAAADSISRYGSSARAPLPWTRMAQVLDSQAGRRPNSRPAAPIGDLPKGRFRLGQVCRCRDRYSLEHPGRRPGNQSELVRDLTA
jgi:hypothetical protein